jgi:hypothetical protein
MAFSEVSCGRFMRQKWRFYESSDTLGTTGGVSFLAQGGSEMIEGRPQRTPPQPGNHAWSYKGVFEHMLLLLLKHCLEREKDRTSCSCKVEGASVY